jgi:hypothetical protein
MEVANETISSSSGISPKERRVSGIAILQFAKSRNNVIIRYDEHAVGYNVSHRSISDKIEFWG